MKDYQQLKQHINQEIDKEYEALVALNDDLADHPEISGQEYETSKKIVNMMRDRGYSVEYPFAGFDTAFRGIYGENTHKHKIAVMVEYDALPEIGHACGHCLSGAISLLAGFALKDVQDALDADVHIVGTPNEEAGGVKCVMVRHGVFDEYDMAIMVHLHNRNLIAPKLQALDSYLYKFYGRSAHASQKPWDGINALNAVQLTFHAMDMLRQHVTPDAQLHGIIRYGGDAPNIVPEFASTEIFIRAEHRHYLNELIRKVDNCAEGAAIATGCKWEKEETAPPYDNLLDNQPGMDALGEVFEELDIPVDDNTALFGSSDAGNVSFICPTFHPCLQVVDKHIPLHTKEFQQAMKTPRAHRRLRTGAQLIAYHIAKIFSDEKKVEAMIQAGPKGK